MLHLPTLPVRPRAAVAPPPPHMMVMPSTSTSAKAASVIAPKAILRSRSAASYQLREANMPPRKSVRMSHFIAVPRSPQGRQDRIEGEPDPACFHDSTRNDT